MALWLVRSGKNGEREDLAIQEKVAVIGFGNLPDLSPVRDREQLRELLREKYPDRKESTLRNWGGQVWSFRDRIAEGDLVAMPFKRRAAIAFGRVMGPYEYRADLPEGARHTRPVSWLRDDIARSATDQDILHSLGAFMTVCQISRHNIEARVRRMLELPSSPAVPDRPLDQSQDDEAEAPIDIERYCNDELRQHIRSRFSGHELAQLVNAVLEAQGYRTMVSPPGADGGVDILGGMGALGFDGPKLCVQVKSGDTPTDIRPIRELDGTMTPVGASQGLFVSWAGFNKNVLGEARQRFFRIRLWDGDELIKAIITNYKELKKEIQADLPLKPIWALVRDEEA